MHTATVEAELHDGGSLRAQFRFADKQEACDSADEFVRLNEPIIANAAISVTEFVNGRFDNALLEGIADIIYERSGREQDEIDQAIHSADEQEVWDSAIGPAIDRVMEMAGIEWAQ